MSEYDGDGVTLSTTRARRVAAAGLRPSPPTTTRAALYQVQHSTTSTRPPAPSRPPALTTNYWYDHRGDLIAEADPGGLVTKDQYDGAGRLVSESITDGAGGTSWAAAGIAGRRPRADARP